MPELPEVETIRRQLEAAAVGKKITKLEIIEPKMFLGDPKSACGQEIVGVGRAAKVLRIFLKNKAALLIHFKLNGQLFLDAGKNNYDMRFTRIILHFTDGTRLLFNDSRKFGWMKIVENFQEPANRAIEPFQANFTFENFKNILAKSRKPVKILLMDQEKIGGIGNIYANESLFAARINPFRLANSLALQEAKKLHQAILRILQKAVDCKGSSGKDEWYRQMDGTPGCYQKHFLVYQRDGQICPANCGGKIIREKQAGRSTFFCPKCQK